MITDVIPLKTMNTNVLQSLVFRWKEHCADGHISWFVSSLESGGQFWGYVHFRTAALNENRSFVGQLDKLKTRQIFDVVASLQSMPIEYSLGTVADGLVGLGTRNEFTTVARYNRETNQPIQFAEIVSVLLPELRLALD